MQAAIEEARQGRAEGGIPIGSVLVLDGKIIGRGHNRRVQEGSVIHHAEMNCLENAGRRPASTYRRCTIYSTLVALSDVQRGHPPLRDSEGRDRGEQNFSRSGRICAFPGCRGGDPARRGLHQLMEDFIAGRARALERGHRGVRGRK